MRWGQLVVDNLQCLGSVLPLTCHHRLAQPFRGHTKSYCRLLRMFLKKQSRIQHKKSTTPRLKMVKTSWKMPFHVMKHGRKGIFLIAWMRNCHFHGKWQNFRQNHWARSAKCARGMKVMLIQFSMSCGKLSISQSVRQITVVHHWPSFPKGLGESPIVLSVVIIFSTLNAMEMMTARLSVLLNIFMRRNMVWLLRKKNVWATSKSDLA